MLRLLTLFVLVISMVKTNAQSVYQQLLQIESNDKMLLKIHPGSTMENVNALLTKIENDPNFSTTSKGNAGYFILDRETGSTIGKEDARALYMQEPYVAYASFVFMQSDGTFSGYANDVFAKAKSHVSSDQVKALAERFGLLTMLPYAGTEDIYKLYFDKQGNTFERASVLFEAGLFDWVEPNMLSSLTPFGTDYGGKTKNMIDCQAVRPNYTNDKFMVDFSQWALGTGTTTQFSAIFLQPYNNTNDVVEWADINVCNAWIFSNGSARNSTLSWPNSDRVTGQGVNVAVVDDGVDTKHWELAPNMRMNGSNVYGYDAPNNPLTGPPPSPFLGNPLYSPITDPGCADFNTGCVSYHGTGVAGIIAADWNNNKPGSSTNTGMAGVAHDAQIMPVKIFWRDNPCDPLLTTWEAGADGIRWSADNGADVINCSWGVHSYGTLPYGSQLIENSIDHAVANGRGGKGCVIVFGSGNNNYFHIGWPSSHDKVISVGAMSMCQQRKRGGNQLVPTPPQPLYPTPGWQSCDQEAFWGSNYGTGQTWSDHITNDPLNTAGQLSVVAPGVKLISTTNELESTPFPGFYEGFWGTSFAAPHVSGVAALILSVNPCLNPDEVKDIIERSADRVSPINLSQYSYGGFGSNGLYNNEMGHGLVNAGNAVTLAYDLYKQNMYETSTKVYKSSHHIYSGANVTDIYPPQGHYTVSNTGRVDFLAPTGNAIHLEPGFQAVYNSYFNAEIITDYCDNSHHHYKNSAPEMSEGITKPKSYDVAVTGMKIYPNPVSTQLNIEFTLLEDEKVFYSISNMLGQQVMETVAVDLTKGAQKQTLETSSLAPGVYTVTVKTGSGLNQFKFVKQ